MEDDQERNRHESSDGSGSESVPSLLQLSLNCVVKRLWLSEINNDWFENRVLKSDRVKHKLHQILVSTSRLPPSIEKMLTENIDIVGNDISDKFTQLSGSKLLMFVIKNREWSDFAPSFWNFVKRNGMNYFTVRAIFETILQNINDGSRLISIDEISFYLSMWKTIPKDFKSRVIVNLCFDGRYKNAELTSYPYDFLPKLLMDFSSEERKKIWMENYLELICKINPSRLSHLMSYTFDNDEQINEFKRQYFVRDGYADRYGLTLIWLRRFQELDQFVLFCSTNESEMEELAKRILHKYFSAHQRYYHVLLQVLRSGGYVSRVIQMTEFQHLFQIPIENVKAYCHELIDGGDFIIMNEFLDYFLPKDKNISSFLQEMIKSFFDDNNLLERKFHSEWLQYRFKQFNDAIENMFATTEEAAFFKKEIMFFNSVFELIAVILFTPDVEQFGYSPNRRISCIKKWSVMFLLSEEDLSKWKEDFMAYSINGVRQKRWCLFSEWVEVFAWFLDSEDKASKFRANLSMDEILLSCFEFGGMFSVSQLNQILRWYYSDDEERIVFFKLRALRECDFHDSDFASQIILGNVREEFNRCENDLDRLVVLRQTLRQEQRAEDVDFVF
ncbi:uncharacterized protein LOC135831415 isoform X9 [Planococcus citri]